MMKESRPLEEKKLTLENNLIRKVAKANINTASKTSDNLSEIEAGPATERENMGSSNEPISVNPSGLQSKGDTEVKTSSNNLSEGSFSEPGNTEKNFRGARASAGYQTMGISNTKMLKSGPDSADKVQSMDPSKNTLSEPTDIMASCNQTFRRNATMLNTEANQANLQDSYPSSLRSSSTCTSYNLEISLSTASDHKESLPLPLQTPPRSSNSQSKQVNLSAHSGETNLAASKANSYRSSALNPLQRCDQPEELITGKINQCTDRLGSCQIVTSKNVMSHVDESFSSITSGNSKIGAQQVLANQPTNYGKRSAAQSEQNMEQMDNSSKAKESMKDEDDTFYAFVILHAQEDDEEAVRLKTKLESITSMIGATFAEDFAEPGRSTFSCVEDAINNSAYTMLLLTVNFNTRLNEMNADSAIMNSLEKAHKYNTVIPLLPRDNSLTKPELPMVLRTTVPMKEKAFEIMAKRVLHPSKIQMQKKIWKKEQLVRKQQEKQRWLREENMLHSQFIRESAKVQDLEQQRRQLQNQQQHLQQPHAQQPQPYQAFSEKAQTFVSIPPQRQDPVPPQYSGTGWAQSLSNIHIQNAKYIMIGNDSTMTVGASEGNSGDEDF